jgi:protein-S-isoprenylcysteine O-methyltransferase Ste14
VSAGAGTSIAPEVFRVAEILAGVAAFVLLGLSDRAAWRGRAALRSAAVAISAILLTAGFVSLSLWGPRLGLSVPLRIAAGVVSLPFLGLLVLSVVIEPSFGTIPGANGPSLYRRGTYALVRHPGIHWFLAFHLLLVLATASQRLAIAIPFWTAANLGLVFVQDRVLFPGIFGQMYSTYRKEVPFLIPTARSFRACCSTLTITRRAG